MSDNSLSRLPPGLPPVGFRMDKSSKDWSTAAQEAENREWLRAAGIGIELKPPTQKKKKAPRIVPRGSSIGTFSEYLQTGTGKPTRRIINSDDRLAVSKAFQKTLQSQQQLSSMLIGGKIQPQYEPLKSGSLKSLPVQDATAPAKRKTKGVSRSADVSRIGSKILTGPVNLQSLLDMQSEKQAGNKAKKEKGHPTSKKKSGKPPPQRTSPWIESTESKEVVHFPGTMDKALKDLSIDAQKGENREWLGVSGSGSRLKQPPTLIGQGHGKRSRPQPRGTPTGSGTFKEYLQIGTGKSAKRIVNSEEKLAVLSKSFQKTLKPIAIRDVRQLIKTPPDNIFETLSNRYDQVLERQPKNREQLPPSHIEELPMPQYQPLKSGSMKSIPDKDVVPPKLKIKGGASRNVSRTGSKNLTGLMNLRSLLEIQSEKPPEEQPIQKSRKLPAQRPSRWIQPSKDNEVVHLTGTEVHGTLQRSVQSIDQAAKIAQNLGNLMSKVALQQNGKQQRTNNDTSLGNKGQLKSNSISTSTSSTTSKSTFSSKGIGTDPIDPQLKGLLDRDRKRNPYNPITDEIKKRADRLTEIVEQTEQNLKLHGAAFGFNSYPDAGGSRKHSPRVGQGNNNPRMNSMITFASTGTDAGASAESPRNKINDDQTEFEFLPEMSYTDQLMLKKLRGLKSSWGDETN